MIATLFGMQPLVLLDLTFTGLRSIFLAVREGENEPQQEDRRIESTSSLRVVRIVTAGSQPHATERQPPKLLDQVRLAIETRHYSSRTEDAYVWRIQGVK